MNGFLYHNTFYKKIRNLYTIYTSTLVYNLYKYTCIQLMYLTNT